VASVNKVILVGNSGRDPEVRYTPSGDAVANISLATSERYKDRSTGESREQTEWHRLVFFGKLAEIVGEYVKKGTPLYVEGKIRTNKWQCQKTGQDRYTTEILCDTMRLLGKKPDEHEAESSKTQGEYQAEQKEKYRSTQKEPPEPEPVQDIGDLEDDIPF